MSEFPYLYLGDSRDGSPEQVQQRMQKWMAWFKQMDRLPVNGKGAVSTAPSQRIQRGLQALR